MKKFIGVGGEDWLPFGYTKDKSKVEEMLKNSNNIEIFDHFGDSFIPKKIIKEFRIIEIEEIQNIPL